MTYLAAAIIWAAGVFVGYCTRKRYVSEGESPHDSWLCIKEDHA